jgi:hypothetical protein
VLDAKPEGNIIARLALTVENGQPTTRMDDETLEILRLDSMPSRALPLLAALAGSANTSVVLDYADGLQLRVGIELH